MIKAVIFDYGGTLVSEETLRLYPQAHPILKTLKKLKLKLALVSRAADPEQRWEDFKRLKIKDYFQVLDVVFRGNTKEFDKIFKKLAIKPTECLIVGDRIKSEIIEGNRAGSVTIWIRQSKFSDELPESKEEKPDYTIDSLQQLLPLINKLHRG